ncbi:hypothetical protein, partial [Rhizobium leguminosarum]|uniref:hypothetical protein n=1 Tax=Rhizobium leguminosarum TaxID=384 RepID=UPI003F98F4FF
STTTAAFTADGSSSQRLTGQCLPDPATGDAGDIDARIADPLAYPCFIYGPGCASALAQFYDE